jgi:hypothetical protein
MKTSHILYHLIRADFWERVRRNSFLIAVGATILLGYLFVPPQDARYLAGVLPHFTSDSGATQYLRGVYNSAWIGSMVALMTALLLSLPGFYLVKNCIERDARTRVGEIIAATPLSRPVYVLGKWLSNLAVLTFLILILALTALVMQLVRGEVLEIELWKLLSPFLAMAFPVAALVAALAVFFEAFTLLRGGLGNVVYFFLWTVGVIVVFENDLFGWELLFSSVQAAAQTSFPAVINASIGINPIQGPLQMFTWAGVSWTAAYVYRQALWVGFALGIVLVAALIFSRFDPAPEGILKTLSMYGAFQRHLFSKRMAPKPGRAVFNPVLESNFLSPMPELTQPPGLALRAGRFRFWRTFLVELRLALKGQRWWWYLVAGGLWAATLLAPLEDARRYFYPLAWIWPLLVWSRLGTRQARHNTEALVFSTPHPIRRQLLAAWLASLSLTLLMGSGMALRFIGSADGASLLAWAVGALFIPCLAAGLGCWSGSSKLFEVVYTTIWYLGPVNKLLFLDFMGVWPAAVAAGYSYDYFLVALLLIGFAIVGRWRRLTIGER